VLRETNVAYPEGVLVVHGPRSEPIAVRLAMDLRSAGISAHPTALEKLVPSDWQKRLPGVTGLVIIYDGQTWIVEDVEAALLDMHPDRPVVFVRSQPSRFNPDFQRFHVAPAFEAGTFSHYQPHQKHWGGYVSVIEYLSGKLPVKDARKRGFAFVSYSSKDRLFIDEVLVPALAACNIGFFDYRFTERLDERKLHEEIERRIKRCALIIACTSRDWHESKHTGLETRLAGKLGKPVVAVTRVGEPVPQEFTCTACVFTRDASRDSQELMKAVGAALSGTRAAKSLRAPDGTLPYSQ